MQFPIHPHMLRHGCGYALANAGHDTRALQLGHKNIQHTVRYTELAPDRFKNFWRQAICGDRRDVGRGRSRSAYPPVQNDSGLAQGPAGSSGAS
jgi:integrase-like protein